MWIYYSFYRVETNIVDKKQNLIFIFYGIVLSLFISLLIQHFVQVDRPEQHLKT
jgi:hypothetical protein